ncbi:MAG: hypothetical protein DMF73_10125, partial [Acidobacteria bacterium]
MSRRLFIAWLATSLALAFSVSGSSTIFIPASTFGQFVRPGPVPTDVAARIQRVEDGLLPDNVIKDQPLPHMKLLDRMKYYETPGVSIAVINNYKVEWARGYGAREVGSNEDVNAET